MRRTTSTVLMGLLALLASACATSSVTVRDDAPAVTRVPGRGVYTWEEESGWQQPEHGSWGPPDHVRAEAFEAFEAGAWADALAGFRALRRLTGFGTPGGDVNFYIAECWFQLGRYEEALEHYRRVYRQDFPAQDLIDRSLQRVFTIGMAYLRGDAICHLVGIISYRCPERGIEILAGHEDGLIVEYPMVSFADTALIEIARYYHENKEYPEAVPLYDRVADDPQSEWAELAAFQAAMATFQQVRGVDYDQRTLQEAERRFTRYLERYPRGDHTAEARDMRSRIREMEGKKNLKIAKFYLRESQPQACSLYLDRVLRDYPNTPAASEAREIQKQLERLRQRGDG